MNHKCSWILIFFGILTISCSEVKSTRYQDTSNLELPPQLKIAEKPKQKIEAKEEIKDTGLGHIVSIAGTTKKPVIQIKKLFDRSWNIVEQALKLKEIEITDKNRELGTFYVMFDPDSQKSADTGLIDNMTFFLFKDDFEEAAYKLTVLWKESTTEVSVELTSQNNSHLLDDDEDREDFDSSVDSGNKLLLDLYRTIRDDLPLN